MKQQSRKEHGSESAPGNSLAIYGVQAVLEAITSGREINKVIVQKDLRNASLDSVINACKRSRIPFQFAPRESTVFPGSRTHQGVVALLSPITYHKLDQLLPQLFEQGKDPFILVLDRITDVRNFGAIARSAFCAGVHAIVVPDQGSAQVTEDAVKTSAGALMKIPVCREHNFKTVMEFLNQSGVRTIGCTEKANKQLPFVDMKGPVAVIMGSEEDGLSNDVIKRCEVLAKIPLEAGVGSLNVSVAAGIAMYEAVRQRMS